MARETRLYVVTYDISDQKRWRRGVQGHAGIWRVDAALSVFQCRLTASQHAELIALLDGIIHHSDDHIVLLDLGPAEAVVPRVVSPRQGIQSRGTRTRDRIVAG